MDIMEGDSVVLRNFYECLIYISSRPRENIQTEFYEIMLQEQDEEFLSKFLSVWDNVFESANDLLSNWQYIRLNERRLSLLMRECIRFLRFFSSSNSFDMLFAFLTSLNGSLSPLADPVRTMIELTVADSLILTDKNDNDYKRYIEIGKHLCDTPELSFILSELRSLRVRTHFSRYAAVIGPSLLGKTQLAFALSNIQKVIYVNLTSETNPQPIYKVFTRIGNLFKKALEADSNTHGESLLKMGADELAEFDGKLLTLGLLAHLMSFPWPQSTEENWLDQFLSICSVKVEKLSISEFMRRFTQVELLDFVLFVDEFPTNSDYIFFLRNLARVTGTPCVLAATNSNIGNMIGVSKRSSSRQDLFRPWVKVITKLPHTEPLFLARFCLFKSGNEERNLSSFITNGTVDVASLFRFLNISHSTFKTKELFKLLFEQGKTCLPGILYLVLSCLDNVFKESNLEASRSDFDSDLVFDRQIWANVCKFIYKETRSRKDLEHPSSMFASCYIMSCGTACMDNLFSQEFLTKFVDKHFYRLGTAQTPAIQPYTICNNTLYLDLENDNIVQITQEKNMWRCCSYFPKFHEDLFIHIVAWGNVSDAENENENQSQGIFHSNKISLAKHFEEIYPLNIFRNPQALKNNSLAQETLVTWAVGNASHFDIFGKTEGLEFMRQVSGHLQSIPVNSEYLPSELLCQTDMTTAFRNFFNRITVPYGVESFVDESFRNVLSNFMDIGHFYRCADSEGFDLRFFIRFDGNICEAFVECKYQDVPTNLSTIMKYSSRSIEKKTRLTLIITSEMVPELEFSYFDLLLDQCTSLGIPYSRNIDRTNPSVIPNFKLNHYSICFPHNSSIGINELRVNALFEHDNDPDGVVIIIKTNFCLPKS